MKLPCKLSTLSLGTLLALSSVEPVTAQEAKHYHYVVIDLGVLQKGTLSFGDQINSTGWVAGSSNLAPGGPQHAFLWDGYGPLFDLGTVGGANSAADGPNTYGEAAIGSKISTADPDHEDLCGYGTHRQCRAAIWRYGKLTQLRNLPGGRNANASLDSACRTCRLEPDADKSASLTIQPIVPASLCLSPSTLVGGKGAIGKVTI